MNLLLSAFGLSFCSSSGFYTGFVAFQPTSRTGFWLMANLQVLVKAAAAVAALAVEAAATAAKF